MENKTKKQLTTFFFITFVLNFLMGVLIYFAKRENLDISMFPTFQMLTPAAGAITALLATNWRNERISKKSYLAYLALSFLFMLATLVTFFLKLDSKAVQIVLNIGIIIFSLAFLVFLITEKKTNKIFSNLNLGRVKSIFLYTGLFILLYITRLAIFVIPSEGIGEFLKIFSINKLAILAVIIINSIFTFAMFFGEEYGWRFFLQPILQKRFGMRKGLIILGLVWGLWHLPLNLFFYPAPGKELLSIVNQLFICLPYAIFFGYAYTKSKSIWTPVLIHYFNNNLVMLFVEKPDSSILQNQDYTLVGVILNLILGLVLFAPFLFSKFNSNKDYRIPTPDERLENNSLDEIEENLNDFIGLSNINKKSDVEDNSNEETF